MRWVLMAVFKTIFLMPIRAQDKEAFSGVSSNWNPRLLIRGSDIINGTSPSSTMSNWVFHPLSYMNIKSFSAHLDLDCWEFEKKNLELVGCHTRVHCWDVSQHNCKTLQLPVESPLLLCIQGQGYIQLVVQNSLCGKLTHSHMLDQVAWYEMKKHFAAHLIPLSLQSVQDEMVSLSLQSIHMKTMLWLLPIASMKSHLAANQLLWALVLVVVVLLIEVRPDLQLRQEISWLPSCSAVPLHHVGFVLLEECVGVPLVLHSWLSKHPHVLVQSLQLQRNHDQSLMLQKSSELVAAVGFVWQESMRSGVEHSWTYLCHLLVFLLCHHHPCLSFLSFLSFPFLFLFSGNIHTHQGSTGLHGPNSLHSSFDHQPKSLHSMSHSIHPLRSIHLHILLHSPCEGGLFSFFLGLFLSLIWRTFVLLFLFLFLFSFLYLCLVWSVFLGTIQESFCAFFIIFGPIAVGSFCFSFFQNEERSSLSNARGLHHSIVYCCLCRAKHFQEKVSEFLHIVLVKCSSTMCHDTCNLWVCFSDLASHLLDLQRSMLASCHPREMSFSVVVVCFHWVVWMPSKHVHLSMVHWHVVLVLVLLLQGLQVQLGVLHDLDNVVQRMQLHLGP